MKRTAHEVLLDNLREAARNDVAGITTGPTLRDHLPADVMPTPEMLLAVHTITGTGEEHRRQRARGNFRMTAETESAFCRAALKRWAVLTPAEPAPEPEPEPELEKHALTLHFFARGPLDKELLETKLFDALQSYTVTHDGAKLSWLDLDGFKDELATAVEARDEGDGNDDEISALWDLAGTACGAFDVFEDDVLNEQGQNESERDQ